MNCLHAFPNIPLSEWIATATICARRPPQAHRLRAAPRRSGLGFGNRGSAIGKNEMEAMATLRRHHQPDRADRPVHGLGRLARARSPRRLAGWWSRPCRCCCRCSASCAASVTPTSGLDADPAVFHRRLGESLVRPRSERWPGRGRNRPQRDLLPQRHFLCQAHRPSLNSPPARPRTRRLLPRIMCMKAAEFGVSGWVRNRRDGTVEAMVQGSEQAVQRMLAWARMGPEWRRSRRWA